MTAFCEGNGFSVSMLARFRVRKIVTELRDLTFSRLALACRDVQLVEQLLDPRLGISKASCGRIRDWHRRRERRRRCDDIPDERKCFGLAALEPKAREPVVEVAVICWTMADVPALDAETRVLKR
ncbi:hypothetical protein IQ62_40330 [Streptomyces scabiei]|nr:hypothetical protein IQ62_40330 [Streptomyces scabiei]